mgnify:CR=1 FL=1
MTSTQRILKERPAGHLTLPPLPLPSVQEDRIRGRLAGPGSGKQEDRIVRPAGGGESPSAPHISICEEQTAIRRGRLAGPGSGEQEDRIVRPAGGGGSPSASPNSERLSLALAT